MDANTKSSANQPMIKREIDVCKVISIVIKTVRCASRSCNVSVTKDIKPATKTNESYDRERACGMLVVWLDERQNKIHYV